MNKNIPHDDDKICNFRWLIFVRQKFQHRDSRFRPLPCGSWFVVMVIGQLAIDILKIFDPDEHSEQE